MFERILAEIVVVVVGAVFAYIVVWARARYKDRAALMAAINFMAASVAMVDTRWARAMKAAAPGNKLTMDDVLDLENKAHQEAIVLAKDNPPAQKMLEKMSPPEASALIKEIICKRFS